MTTLAKRQDELLARVIDGANDYLERSLERRLAELRGEQVQRRAAVEQCEDEEDE